MGQVIIPKKHHLCDTSNGFQMTPYLQDQVCYIGQKEVFEEGSETLERLIGVEVSNKQIQRVSEYYGQCLEDQTKQEIEESSLGQQTGENTDDVTYAMADGSMVLTREEGWKEIKLGRVFKGNENIPITKNRHWIKESKYCAYLGGFQAFLERFELLLKGMANLVFIADGAKWFWDWISIYYPEAIQILDYYHAKQYLCEFALLAFKNKEAKEKWIKTQDTLLLKDKITKVIGNIKAVTGLRDDAEKYREKIISYYQNNQSRMLYGTYKNKGLLIGSGPIESAHRNVIQKRLKLSGQRWTKYGVQTMASLRVAHKSNNWQQVVEIIKTGKIAA